MASFPPALHRPRALAGALVLAVLGSAAVALGPGRPRGGSDPSPPARLSRTGLYADPATLAVARGVLSYTPQYPLWSDGATKRRWIRIPEGRAIDASDPDHFDFPVGTRIWKEFSFGRRVETRYMERRADGAWTFATYRWNEDGTDALLVPPGGAPAAAESAPGVWHDIPSLFDCRACHGDGRLAVLGFSALQLSADRDPLAPHRETPAPGAVDLAGLARRGLVRNLDAALLHVPPRVAASSDVARAALGYLHANCSSCHRPDSDLDGVGLSFLVRLGGAQRGRSDALATAVGRASRFGRAPGVAAPLRVAPGDPDGSVVVRRMSSQNALVRMPPFGTHAVDPDALALVARWIRELENQRGSDRREGAAAAPARSEP